MCTYLLLIANYPILVCTRDSLNVHCANINCTILLQKLQQIYPDLQHAQAKALHTAKI